jgi:hypothetical protein
LTRTSPVTSTATTANASAASRHARRPPGSGAAAGWFDSGVTAA